MEALLQFVNPRPNKFSVERLESLHKDLIRKIDTNSPMSKRFAFLSKTQNEQGEMQQDLTDAFYALSAFHYIATERSSRDVSPSTISLARNIEAAVIADIRSIGEVVVNSSNAVHNSRNPHELRADPIFEYFGEHSILELFVRMVESSPYVEGGPKDDGVLWTPRVKAQVLHTVSLMVSSTRNESSLFYILSKNDISRLIQCVQPISKWTDPAFECMLPAYCDLLKNLCLQLVDRPSLSPFFVSQVKRKYIFPLFTSAIDTATSIYAQSNSFVHSTCLNVLATVLQIEDELVHSFLSESKELQEVLVDHLCHLLQKRYKRIVDLATGPIVDPIRSHSIIDQWARLDDQISVINDMFWSGIHAFNVSMCEKVLQFAKSLCLDIDASAKHSFGSTVGYLDSDIVPEREAKTQTAIVFLSRLVAKVEYPPLVRLLFVAVFHPSASITRENLSSDERFVLTASVNSVAKSNGVSTEPNVVRQEILKGLSGSCGLWRLIACAMLFDTVFDCKILDSEITRLVKLVPEKGVVVPEYCEALFSFLERGHEQASALATTALELTTSIVLRALNREITVGLTNEGALWAELVAERVHRTRNAFYASLMNQESDITVSSIFVDILESCVNEKYRPTKAAVDRIYDLTRTESKAHATMNLVLVRKDPSVKINEIEKTRFYARMALHYRAVYRVIQSSESHKKGKQCVPVDYAESLCDVFVSLRPDAQLGSTINLRGRMAFKFHSVFSDPSSSDVKNTLVLDPADMIVSAPITADNPNLGSLVSCIPLLHVVAAARDSDWLHIAVNHEDVKGLIKNGNMAVRFDSPSTCLVVEQYLTRSRHVLRQELLSRVKAVFSPHSDAMNDDAVDFVKEAKTY